MFEYLTPTPEETPELALILSQALHFGSPTPEGVQPWIERVGNQDFRYTRVDGRMAAGLQIIWMNQWFGGVKIPCAGITVVGAAPEYRGKGAASWLIRRMHQELRE